MSNETKQTALQWLLCEPLEWIVDKTDGSQIIRFPKGSIEQAKEMEKEQIEQAELRGKEIIIIKHTEYGGNK